MHIPDGFLDTKTWVTTAVISVAAISYASAKARQKLDERQLPILGVMSAFIFAGQMINFPVAAGASGHLLGAALATIILGPWSACMILATVLAVQAVFFQDGGITALGASILNMAVVAVLVSHFSYRLLIRMKLKPFPSSFIAAWLSVVIASALVALQLAVSGTTPFLVFLLPVVGIYALIGIGEGLITAVVVAFVAKAKIIDFDLVVKEGDRSEA